MNIDIGYDPLPWAVPFHSGGWMHACLAGGLGGGKSTAAIQELKACAVENPGSTWLIGRKTLPALRDTTLKTFNALMEPGLIKAFNKANLVATLVNNSEFIFRPLDDLEKMKSMEISGFFINEANEVELDLYNTLKARVRQKVNGKPPTRYRTIIDLNPTDEDHWIPQLFLHNPPSGHALFHSSTLDNAANLPPGYIDGLRATYSKDEQDRLILGLFRKVHAGRPVYPEFSRGNFVASVELNPKFPIVRGWDFGYNHPSCVWLQMERSQIKVLGEVLGKHVYLDDFIKNHVLPFERNILKVEDNIKRLDYCDPRGADESDKGKTSVQILRDQGIYPAYRRTWIEEGVKALRSRINTMDQESGLPNFLIHPRCTILIEGFRGGYKRMDGEETPEKDGYYEHLQDGLRYAVIHALQRANINRLQALDQQSARVYVNPRTGYRREF